MEGMKKWLSERTAKKNGLYVHYSPPKLLDVVSAAQLRQLARGGGANKLERAVLAGQGRRLLAEAEALPLSNHQQLPALIAKCEALHAAVERGSLLELQEILECEYQRRKLVECRDEAGAGLLHKAVYFDYMDIAAWLVQHYPQLVHQRDTEGRTPLHYTAVCRDAAGAAALLEGAGAARGARDAAGRTPAGYRGAARTLLALPRPPERDMPPDHKNPPGLVIKRHNIRIWFHDCDMARLQRVVWEGHGARLLSEVSNQPVVKRFLEAVPYIMNTIRDIHHDVIQNDLEGLMKHAGEPVPPQILSSRDGNNMTVMHKAAGLGHGGILGYIADRYPQGINDVDNDGRTPLHYAAAVRDDQHMYNTLVGMGADEGAVDNDSEVVKENDVTKQNVEEKEDDEEKPAEETAATADDVHSTTEKFEEQNVEEDQNGEIDEIKHENDNNTTEKDDAKDEDVETGEESNKEADSEKADDNEETGAAVSVNKDLWNSENEPEPENVTEIESQHDNIKQDEEKIPEDDENTNKPENNESDIEEPRINEDDLQNKNDDSSAEETTNDDHHETTDEKANRNSGKEDGASTNEGNNNNEHNEDDDDVQVPGDSHSEYSDIHLRSTAEAIDTRSATRGYETNGRNTQDSLIEGVVNGDAEQDAQDASITQRVDSSVHGDILVVDHEIDPEVTDLINTANMEMLATLVLNGEGLRLVGRRSFNVELQAFLDNVPTYMQKINKVHQAARAGNIRDLQAALDRRKFAIARDSISPNGATPLHVATVFGRTNIIKYLGGRFPETLSAVDFEGRTALHYAAVIPDNGHYYNMLQQLGANGKDLDDSGQSAEEYLKNPGLLPFSQLLSDYGISEEAAQDMLSDKGTSNDANGHMDIPEFKTDEGRYLAKSLGDPLIKGLTEVASVKPKDPVAFLASFLQNFPEHEKVEIGTQGSNLVVTRESAEVENEQPAPPPLEQPRQSQPLQAARSAARTATRPHRPIDVVTIDPQPETSSDAPEVAFSSVNRDEHGQSMLHFAAARTHTRNALFQLIQESDISLGYRDELYRTARDVSIQANVPENTMELDRWVLQLAARGNTEKIMELLLEGYDHILDVVDDEGVSVTEVVRQRGDEEMSSLLASIPAFEESRESLHGAVRRGDLAAVEAAVSAEGGRTLARGHNSFGRTALHVAVLAQHEDIVAHLAQTCPELLRIGDNLERTPLHYAMGVEKMESLSRILIRAGAKRVLKDLKGRQPSYYFMNKSDILRLKEEEEVY